MNRQTPKQLNPSCSRCTNKSLVFLCVLSFAEFSCFFFVGWQSAAKIITGDSPESRPWRPRTPHFLSTSVVRRGIRMLLGNRCYGNSQKSCWKTNNKLLEKKNSSWMENDHHKSSSPSSVMDHHQTKQEGPRLSRIGIGKSF